MRFADGARGEPTRLYRVIARRASRRAFGLPAAAWPGASRADAPEHDHSSTRPRRRPATAARRRPHRTPAPDRAAPRSRPVVAAPRRTSRSSRPRPWRPRAAPVPVSDRRRARRRARAPAVLRRAPLRRAGPRARSSSARATTALYVLDQHAAAERVTFDRLKRGIDAPSVAQPEALLPRRRRASRRSRPRSSSKPQEPIARTRHGGARRRADEVAVHAVPRLLAPEAPERLVRDLARRARPRAASARSPARSNPRLATMACHGSVRAGDVDAARRGAGAPRALDDVDFAGHCPHGRPVVMRIGWDELEPRRSA